jgi:DNA-binding Lrp family transcriptional regulator
VTELDRIDLRILAELLSDARASQIELAEKVGLSPTACARRIRQLEETGIIRGYRADLEPTALGLVTTVVVTITLEKAERGSISPRSKQRSPVAPTWCPAT